MSETLEPPDRERCQAEQSNGRGPFTLGGGHRMIRCAAAPTVVVTEALPGSDGLTGSMSLCDECLAVALKQLGVNYFSVKRIER
jgi:hypothetical protein